MFIFVFLTYFTWHNVLQVYSCCSKWHISFFFEADLFLRRREAEREREREIPKQALSAVSVELDVGFDPVNREIMI